MSNYQTIYTIGKVRRYNLHSIADKDGYYLATVGE